MLESVLATSQHQVFVALEGWGGIRFSKKTGFLESKSVAVVPPHAEHTITAASPQLTMCLGNASASHAMTCYDWYFLLMPLGPSPDLSHHVLGRDHFERAAACEINIEQNDNENSKLASMHSWILRLRSKKEGRR